MLTPLKVLLLEVRLNEMAQQISHDFVSKLTSNHNGINPQFYYAYKELPVIQDVEPGVSLHGATTANGSAYFATLDHNNQRAIHITKVIKKSADLKFPVDHLEQELVDKDSSHPIGNITGYARNFAYTHWMTSHLPFRSSHKQAIGGHKMWKKYSKQALDDGKLVYYHSPETGFVRLNHDNLDEYHSRYFGTDDTHLNRSLVLSHTKL